MKQLKKWLLLRAVAGVAGAAHRPPGTATSYPCYGFPSILTDRARNSVQRPLQCCAAIVFSVADCCGPLGAALDLLPRPTAGDGGVLRLVEDGGAL